jgi:hypothetical protein
MNHKALLTACLTALVWFALIAPSEAGHRRARIRIVQPVQNCGEFYEPYYIRGFGWGSGPGLGVGFGTFEGALPQYPSNSFPNWYGECLRWGHYIATGTAR